MKITDPFKTTCMWGSGQSDVDDVDDVLWWWCHNCPVFYQSVLEQFTKTG